MPSLTIPSPRYQKGSETMLSPEQKAVEPSQRMHKDPARNETSHQQPKTTLRTRESLCMTWNIVCKTTNNCSQPAGIKEEFYSVWRLLHLHNGF